MMAVITAEDDGMLRLTETEIRIPYGFIRRTVRTVVFSDITELTILDINRQMSLVIKYPGGKISVNQRWLPGSASFEQVCAHIIARSKVRVQEKRVRIS
jgi:hypothetical protein